MSTTSVSSPRPRGRSITNGHGSMRPLPSDCMDRLLELTYRAEQSHFWFRGFRSYVRPELARAVQGRSAPRLLDCGCGTGSNLAMLEEFGDAFGFDLTWNGLAFARTMGRRHI